jgi:hypothetical protein
MESLNQAVISLSQTKSHILEPQPQGYCWEIGPCTPAAFRGSKDGVSFLNFSKYDFRELLVH